MKKWLLVVLLLALALCAGAALGEADSLDWRALETGDSVLVRYDATGAFVSDKPNGAGLMPVTDVQQATVFALEFDAEGYMYLCADSGYLTSGPTGNSLGINPEKSELALWKCEDAQLGNSFYLRNKAAMYGDSTQYLEEYSGRITTYGLRSGGSAYVFSLVSSEGALSQDVADAPEVGEKLPLELAVMLTGDIHGSLFHTYYASGTSGTGNGGLTRLATLINGVRDEYANTLLIDTGDLVQGTPLTYYYCFLKPDAPDPSMMALRTLGYDAWVPGNHEFNYGLKIFNYQIECALAEDTEDEKRMPVLLANYVRAGEGTPWAGSYIVREFEAADGQSVRVGIIGLGTPNIPNWEPPANYAGIEFLSFIKTWNQYASILKNDEKCDLVIVACHSGVEEIGETLIDGEYYEWSNQVAALVTHSTDIDLVLGAHTHFSGVNTLKNLDGEDVQVLQAGSNATQLGVAYIEYDPSTGEKRVSCELLMADANTPPDAYLTSKLSAYEKECWDEYMNEVIGVCEGDFESAGNMLAPSAFLDLVNEIQLSACYDKRGYTPSTEDDVRPDMSITAPLNSGDGVLIPSGDIKYGQLFTLYRYENWLYSVKMSAPELRAWLEAAAENQYGINALGELYGGGTYCDCLYGEGVSYTIDISREVGDRVHDLCFKGTALDMSDTQTMYTVVVNNYRYTGGGSYCKYAYNWLSANGYDSDFVIYDGEAKTYAINDARQVFSTQYGMPFGDDAGQARSLIADYIRAQGTLSPTITSNWQVVLGNIG